eukprot:6396096-Amphidinium_carterae.1
MATDHFPVMLELICKLPMPYWQASRRSLTKDHCVEAITESTVPVITKCTDSNASAVASTMHKS